MDGKAHENLLTENSAVIYDLCHTARTYEAILERTGIEVEKTKGILSTFIKNKIMINISGKYLSLAIRPKQELINNYFSNQ
jgi:hypothetical protein